ncbi:cell division protein FtsQ [Propionibacteriaceae bacterium ES.041]|uniref:POTRA domain-containing protein n=1 Tax=Enemella evansiae TaxID=2016499 RepID=A0A255GJH7_9ACTN|nr:FtsQ-type POTRA domain-containing protein [Enemella evansiae]OYN93073.1 hypothetical protein CGZ95_20705 [Enemella evansiae]OYO14696.1 hypothetical protein CGZ94_09015 [Enemella evansiae]PFG67906.1 cell division protein FtsQ [Propionibacteriaceae bacterium ES.041]
MSSVGDLNRMRRGRRLKDRRRRLLISGIAALVVLLLLVAGWLVLLSPVLALKQVVVSGTSLLTAEEVTATAAAPMGRPLARVAEQPIADRVATLPQVQQVRVVRSWPTSLKIEVTERQPAFVINRGGRWLLVDEEGIAFVSLTERPEKLIEVRTELVQPEALRQVAQVTGAMPEDLAGQVERVEVPGPDSIKVGLRGGREIFYGSGADAELKGQVAGALVRATKAKWIDVSAPGHPATR